MWNIIVKMVDAEKIGGWVRAAVASILAVLFAKWPVLTSIVGPDMQTAVGVFLSGAVVGLWSTIAKANA